MKCLLLLSAALFLISGCGNQTQEAPPQNTHVMAKSVTIPKQMPVESKTEPIKPESSKYPFEQLKIQMTQAQVKEIFGHDGTIVGNNQGYESLRYNLPDAKKAICIFYEGSLYSWDYEQANTVLPTKFDANTSTVYVSETGQKYHLKSCRTLKDSVNLSGVTKADATARGYEACKVCKP